MKLRQICLQSDRIDEISFAAFKKEIGAIEIHGLEDYFFAIIKSGKKVSNKCGSIVAYLCNITDDKPFGDMKWKGGSVPDIDMDFESERRKEVVTYLKHKYGLSRVANIGTHQKMYAKAAVRRVAKALGYSVQTGDMIAKLIPDPKQGVNWLIGEAIEESSQLREAIRTNHEVREVVKWTERIEGLVVARSQHAAGILIADKNIKELAPMFEVNGDIVSELTGPEMELMGMLKMDILGLKTLDIIEDALSLIKSRRKIDLDIDAIDLNDDRIFKLMSTGNLLGVFQLEGSGISAFTKEFKPTKFMDISLISSIYRPGPMQYIKDVLKVKRGEVNPNTHSNKYPLLKPILSETYEMFIYQEQVQQMVQILAGYNDSEADEFRKIVSKKLKDKMPKEKERFSAKAIEKGMKPMVVDSLWEEIEDFSSYCFNKSHSVAYSVLSAQTAYLKARYPVEFYVANIIQETGEMDKVAALINEARQLGIYVLLPDINESNAIITIVNDKVIRFGLGGIKGVGESASSPIIEERESGGKFTDIVDFVLRVKPKSNVLKALISAGAFDSLHIRKQLMDNEFEYVNKLNDLISYISSKNEDIGFLKEIAPRPVYSMNYTIAELMALEEEYTGMQLSCNLFELHKNRISKYKQDYKARELGILTEIIPWKSGKGGGMTVLTTDNQVMKGIYFLRDKKSDPSALKGKLVTFNYKKETREETETILFSSIESLIDEKEDVASIYILDITSSNYEDVIRYMRDKIDIKKVETRNKLLLNIHLGNINYKREVHFEYT